MRRPLYLGTAMYTPTQRVNLSSLFQTVDKMTHILL